MPIGLLRAYLAMLPRLRAEGDRDAYQAAVVARSSQVEPGDAQRWVREVERAAAGEPDATARPAPASPDALAAMGIGVVMAEPAHV